MDAMNLDSPERKRDRFRLDDDDDDDDDVSFLRQPPPLKRARKTTSRLDLNRLDNSETIDEAIDWVEGIPAELWVTIVAANVGKRLDYQWIQRIVALGNRTLYEYTKDEKLWRYMYESLMVAPSARRPLSRGSLLETFEDEGVSVTALGHTTSLLREESHIHYDVMLPYVVMYGKEPDGLPMIWDDTKKARAVDANSTNISTVLLPGEMQKPHYIERWRVWKRMVEVERRRRNYILDKGEQPTFSGFVDAGTRRPSYEFGDIKENYEIDEDGRIVEMDYAIRSLRAPTEGPVAVQSSMVQHRIYESVQAFLVQENRRGIQMELGDLENEQPLSCCPWPVIVGDGRLLLRLPNNTVVACPFGSNLGLHPVFGRTVSIWARANTALVQYPSGELRVYFPEAMVDGHGVTHLVYASTRIDLGLMIRHALMLLQQQEDLVYIPPRDSMPIHTVTAALLQAEPTVLFSMRVTEKPHAQWPQPPFMFLRGVSTIQRGRYCLPRSVSASRNIIVFGYHHGVMMMGLHRHHAEERAPTFLQFTSWKEFKELQPLRHLQTQKAHEKWQTDINSSYALMHKMATLNASFIDDEDGQITNGASVIIPAVFKDETHRFADYVEVACDPTGHKRFVVVLGVYERGETVTFIDRDEVLRQEEEDNRVPLALLPMHYAAYAIVAPNHVHKLCESETEVYLETHEADSYNTQIRSTVDSLAIMLPRRSSNEDDDPPYEAHMDHLINVALISWFDLAPARARYAKPMATLTRYQSPFASATLYGWSYTLGGLLYFADCYESLQERRYTQSKEEVLRLQQTLTVIMPPRTGYRTIAAIETDDSQSPHLLRERVFRTVYDISSLNLSAKLRPSMSSADLVEMRLKVQNNMVYLMVLIYTVETPNMHARHMVTFHQQFSDYEFGPNFTGGVRFVNQGRTLSSSRQEGHGQQCQVLGNALD